MIKVAEVLIFTGDVPYSDYWYYMFGIYNTLMKLGNLAKQRDHTKRIKTYREEMEV